MAFTGNEGASISLTEAGDWTANYRAASPGETLAQFYGTNKLNEILNQPNCVGIRIYYSLDTSGAKKLILVGADANENDLTDGVIIEFGIPCPVGCGEGNVLNGN